MYNNQYPVKPPPPSHKKRNIIIGIAAGILLLILCCCAVAAAVIFVDPFGWDLIGRLSGKADTTALAMPDNTTVYMGVNLLNMTPDKIDRVVKPFALSLKNAGVDVKDSADALKQFDDQMAQELGLTTQDITPWIGQFAGIGIANIKLTESGGIDKAQLVVALEARDKGAADKFVLKLRDAYEKKMDIALDESTFKGVTIYSNADTQFAFCRSGGLFLLSLDVDTLKSAIDAQGANSLGKSGAYKDLVGSLPNGRAVTLYTDSAQMQKLLPSLMQSMNLSGASSTASDTLVEGWVASAMSLSVVDAGLEIDLVSSYDPQKLTDDQKNMLGAYGSAPKTVSMLPDNTLIYIAGKGINVAWETYRQTIIDATSQEDFDNSMGQVEAQFKINPDSDLLPYLDGDYALAMVPSNKGYLAKMSNMDLGVVALFGTKSPDKILDVVAKINEAMDLAGSKPDEIATDLYQLLDPFSEETIAGYGVKNSYLGIATHGDLLQDIFANKSSLGKNPGFQFVQKAFPSGMSPILYVNLKDTLDLVSSGMEGSDRTVFLEAVKIFEPLTNIAMGGSALKNNRQQMTIILFITK